MAPTPSPVLVYSPNHPSGRHVHHHHHPRRRPAPSRTERLKARAPDSTSPPSVVFESLPLPVAPTPSESVALAPEPSAVSTSNNQPQQPNQLVDVPGNIVAAVVVIVLILGGLIGLMIGGESLRRQVRNAEKKAALRPSRGFGPPKSEPAKRATISAHQRTPTRHERFSYDEKTLTPLTRPPPVLRRERQRRLSDVWPIRRLSRAMYHRRSCPEQIERRPQHAPPPVTAPQTTWSEFSPVSPYIPPPRTVLAAIPEEREDSQSMDSDFAVMLGVALRRSVESGSMVPTSDLKRDTSQESSTGAARRGSHDFEIIRKEEGDEDAKSLGSSAPDMTSDGGESSRSSMVSLESLEHDRESLGEEVFELKRAQTRSMQMNKGVLLSLSLKTLGDNEAARLECGPSRSSSVSDVAEGGLTRKEYHVEQELGLAMLGGNFSAVNLDEFPSPPSILPMIPSFVSGF